ncbi:MAG: DUF1540 domain-containing protein [Sulfobacillus sp.]|nr:DUF1540 domain-containing protein [Sulfobacillus sp.]
MATIYCQVSQCRHNREQECQLATIEVGPGATTFNAPGQETGPLEASTLSVGYATEYALYEAYRESQPESLHPGALCLSFSPQ